MQRNCSQHVVRLTAGLWTSAFQPEPWSSTTLFFLGFPWPTQHSRQH